MGMTRAEVAAQFDAIVDFAGVGGFIDTQIKRYSSGMNARLGFSIAAHLDPDVLIIDEVLSVGDMAFQQRCVHRMGEFKREGVAIVFVSHNLQAVSNLCDRALYLRRKALALGPANEVIDAYVRDAFVPTDESQAGEFAIRATSLCRPDGSPVVEAVEPGARLELRVTFEAVAPFDDVVFAFRMLRSTDQLLVYDGQFTQEDLGSGPADPQGLHRRLRLRRQPHARPVLSGDARGSPADAALSRPPRAGRPSRDQRDAHVGRRGGPRRPAALRPDRSGRRRARGRAPRRALTAATRAAPVSMRVAIFGETRLWGGLEVHAVALAEWLADQGHTVSLVCLGPETRRVYEARPPRRTALIEVAPPARRSVRAWWRALQNITADAVVLEKGTLWTGGLALDSVLRLKFGRYVAIQQLEPPDLPARQSRRHLAGLLPGIGLWWYRWKWTGWARSLAPRWTVCVSDAVRESLASQDRLLAPALDHDQKRRGPRDIPSRRGRARRGAPRMEHARGRVHVRGGQPPRAPQGGGRGHRGAAPRGRGRPQSPDLPRHRGGRRGAAGARGAGLRATPGRPGAVPRARPLAAARLSGARRLSHAEPLGGAGHRAHRSHGVGLPGDRQRRGRHPGDSCRIRASARSCRPPMWTRSRRR